MALLSFAACKKKGGLEGATAQFEVDVTSLRTDNPTHADQLRSTNYLDTYKYPQATFTIDMVKRMPDGTYSANARVDLMGIERHIPITIQVVAETPQKITAQVSTQLSRHDFNIGAPSVPFYQAQFRVAGAFTLTR